MNQCVVVLGPWSCGSSAVAGVLDHLGACTCPPHHLTNDPKTPNSFEPAALKEIMARHIRQEELRIVGNPIQMATEILQWLDSTAPPTDEGKTIVLKYGTLGLIIPTLTTLLRPKYIVVRRPYGEIERTRARRGWSPIYGYLGARIIYDQIYKDLIAQGLPFFDIFFPEFISHPEREIQRLVEFVGLSPDAAQMEKALSFLRR